MPSLKPAKTLLDLPNDMVVQITQNLSAADLVRLSATCRSLQEIVKANPTSWQGPLSDDLPGVHTRKLQQLYGFQPYSLLRKVRSGLDFYFSVERDSGRGDRSFTRLVKVDADALGQGTVLRQVVSLGWCLLLLDQNGVIWVARFEVRGGPQKGLEISGATENAFSGSSLRARSLLTWGESHVLIITEQDDLFLYIEYQKSLKKISTNVSTVWNVGSSIFQRKIRASFLQEINIELGFVKKQFPVGSNRIIQVAGNRTRLAILHDSGTVYVHDRKSKEPKVEVITRVDPIMAICSDSTFLVIATRRSISILDLMMPELQTLFQRDFFPNHPYRFMNVWLEERSYFESTEFRVWAMDGMAVDLKWAEVSPSTGQIGQWTVEQDIAFVDFMTVTSSCIVATGMSRQDLRALAR